MYTIKQRQEMDEKRFYRVNEQWVDEQLKAVGATKQTAGVVKALINAVVESDLPRGFELDMLFMNALALVKGHPIATDQDQHTLVDLRPGEFAVRDIVRVRDDAYDGNYGIENNGRLGRIATIQGPTVLVVYKDDTLDNAKSHKIGLLQKVV